MRFEKKAVGDVTVVRLKGHTLTGHEAPEVKTALLGLLLGEGEKFLVDLAEVETMDSTGLGALLFGIRQAQSHDKDIRFCHLNEKAKFLVKIAHLESVIDLYDDEAEALADFYDD